MAYCLQGDNIFFNKVVDFGFWFVLYPDGPNS